MTSKTLTTVNHYSNVLFAIVLIVSLIYSHSDKDISLAACVITSIGWAISQILKLGLTSLIIIMSSPANDDDNHVQQ